MQGRCAVETQRHARRDIEYEAKSVNGEHSDHEAAHKEREPAEELRAGSLTTPAAGKGCTCFCGAR